MLHMNVNFCGYFCGCKMQRRRSPCRAECRCSCCVISNQGWKKNEKSTGRLLQVMRFLGERYKLRSSLWYGCLLSSVCRPSSAVAPIFCVFCAFLLSS